MAWCSRAEELALFSTEHSPAEQGLLNCTELSNFFLSRNMQEQSWFIAMVTSNGWVLTSLTLCPIMWSCLHWQIFPQQTSGRLTPAELLFFSSFPISYLRGSWLQAGDLLVYTVCGQGNVKSGVKYFNSETWVSFIPLITPAILIFREFWGFGTELSSLDLCAIEACLYLLVFSKVVLLGTISKFAYLISLFYTSLFICILHACLCEQEFISPSEWGDDTPLLD